MTPQERRLLRGIERALHADDPALARLLAAGPGPASGSVVSRIAWSIFLVALVQLASGALLGDAGLLTGGQLLLMLLPAVVLLLARALRPR